MADLSPEVDDYWDRGLLGLAVPPDYPTDDNIYVLYTRDAPLGGTTPTWNDGCPTPPGPTTDGCVVSGRLSTISHVGRARERRDAARRRLVPAVPQPLDRHAVFGSDGYLYAGGGEGANFNACDYGQFGDLYPADKANPCKDPPGGVGTALTPADAEGGSLRSQSALRTDGPTLLNGASSASIPDRAGRTDQPLGR